jgi:hypothetical protein
MTDELIVRVAHFPFPRSLKFTGLCQYVCQCVYVCMRVSVRVND